jgi:membrane fusion protein, heavy metal efflux system
MLGLRTTLLLTFIGLVLHACSRHPGARQQAQDRRANGTVVLSPESRDYIIVEPAANPPATTSRALLARVTYDERKVAILGPPVSGRVTSVEVVAGSRVKRGDPLLTIRSADLAAAQAQLAEARQTRLLAEQTAARASMLVRQGAASEAEKQIANTSLATAVLEEGRASGSLASLGGTSRTNDYVLKSPINGTVVDRSVAVGNAVAADQGEALLTISDLSTVWVVADVYEPDLPIVHAGDRATISVPAIPGQTFHGTIAYLGDVVDATTRAARARIELANPDGLLRPGMFVEVAVEGRVSSAAELPTASVLARRDEFYVFLRLPDGAFERRTVTLGAQTGEHVMIQSGIKPGDPVVTRGAILLDAEASAVF